MPTPTPLTSDHQSLLLHYLPLLDIVVERLIYQFPQHADKEELKSIGLKGLIAGVLKYNHTQTHTFEHYLLLKIKGAILDELRRLDYMPRDARAKHKLLENNALQLSQRFKRAPTNNELRESMGLTQKGFEKLQKRIQPLQFISLNQEQINFNHQPLNLNDTIKDDKQIPSSVYLEQQEIITWLKLSLHILSERQQSIMIAHYYEGERLSQIAKKMNISEARICQLHSQSIAKLRKEWKKNKI